MERRGKTVAALDDCPELTTVEAYYSTAFSYLSPMRQMGLGLGAIPIGCYNDYYQTFNAPHGSRAFCRILRAIDNDYLRENQDTK